jgi:hypothetical protein
MRFNLRTLFTAVALGPPMLAFAWFYVSTPQEFIGWLTMIGVLAMSYWSIGFWLSGKHPSFSLPREVPSNSTNESPPKAG